MNPERWQQIEAIFQSAIAVPVTKREAYLAQACQGDETLRREVEALLAADQEASDGTLAMTAQVAAEMFAATPALSRDQLLSHYRIESQIGAGGMGLVYLAQDTRLQRKVALKVLPAHFTHQPERLRRFVQEAQAASALNHPNILTIYEIGEAGTTRFIAMEYIAGQTLRAWERNEDAALTTKLDIALQIASALVAAHTAGIIHRDIKPENVMVRPDGFVKVLDFGLAKLTERRGDEAMGRQGEEADTSLAASPRPPVATSPTTTPGVVVGTTSYMSPEQARGEKVDARTDIFSFGIVLYELLAGRLPFVGATSYEMVAAILNQEPQPLSPDPNAMPAALQTIIAKALQKDRAQSYANSRELYAELEELRDEIKLAAKRSGPKALAALTPDIKSHNAKHSRPNTGLGLSTPRRHNRAMILGLLLVLLAAASIGLYWRTATTEAPIESIAVLPFANQNNDPQIEYLADGIPEGIINSLAQLPQLKVMSRNSAFRFKGKESDAQEIGQKLGVRAVLIGRIAQQSENLLISLELVDTHDNRQLWGQQFNRRTADIFAIQEEIARAISEKLRLKLTGTERQQLAKRSTENVKAYQYYLQGKAYAHRQTRENMTTAIRYYEKALAEDADYALVYTGLAEVYGTFASFGFMDPLAGRKKLAEAAQKSVSLDDNLAEAHAMLGFTRINFAPFDFLRGDPELKRALELSPGSALAHQYWSYSLLRQGRLNECLSEILKAHELDPLSSNIARNVAYVYYFKRDYKKAMERLRKANELGPGLSSPTEIGVYIYNGLFDEALAGIEQAKRVRKDDPVLLFSPGMIYAAQGKRAEAAQVIQALEEKSGANLTHALWIAKIYATLNEPEPTLNWLERGLDAGVLGAFYKDEPVWDAVRNDPRFGDLLRRMGIPQ
ncbi:MAG: protein kinase [Blastocatellia bacterium]|nr:protein kinase [Blastocatellia bacterium]